MNYGKALRIARAVTGLQQRELAQRAGLNPSHISLIEKGSRKPSVGAIAKLCDAMEIPASLFTMLAAESEDLKGIEEGEFEAIGRYLGRFLIQNESTAKPSKKRAPTRKLPRSA
jgi:transcriptional regulator with XRE-family HTH domain